jgi:two-component sensor histidine kinase
MAKKSVLPLTSEGKALNRVDLAITALYEGLFIRYRLLSLAGTIALYVAIVLIFGNNLRISSNYFVILPVIVSSICFSFWGGLVSGILALPCNLLLFVILGHPEYSPANAIIAEISGIIVGFSLGYLNGYYKRLIKEIDLRKKTEARLRETLKEKDTLLNELNHRVKNNLNVVKSLINLQISRTSSREFAREAKNLENRIYAISLVQELLHNQGELADINPGAYLRLLATNLVKGYSDSRACVELDIQERLPNIDIDMGTNLGLIVNEVVSNSLRFALRDNVPVTIRISLRALNGGLSLSVRDNGLGFSLASAQKINGLGLTLVQSLTASLRGSSGYSFDGGTLFKLDFPIMPPARQKGIDA